MTSCPQSSAQLENGLDGKPMGAALEITLKPSKTDSMVGKGLKRLLVYSMDDGCINAARDVYHMLQRDTTEGEPEETPLF